MPPRPRLETERSIEIRSTRLSPEFGCGLMLEELHKYDDSDPLLAVMDNYGYRNLAADKDAARTISNRGLLKSFYDNAFGNKLSLRRNFHQTFGEKNVLLAYDPQSKSAWFIGESPNRMALVNYFRDAVSLGLKPLGVMLVGATVRLSPFGWQNLHDLLTDAFFDAYPKVKRIEVMSLLAGVRWREPNLGLGVTFLNLREAAKVIEAANSALHGRPHADIQD